MPFEIESWNLSKLQSLTWFQFYDDPLRLNVQLHVIEREFVYYQLRSENIRILGVPVIDFFLRVISIMCADGKRAFRHGHVTLEILKLLVLNHTTSRTFEDTFSRYTLTAHFPPSQHMDLILVLKESHEKRKQLLTAMHKWLYKHVLLSYDLLGLCESYYDWRVNSKITLCLID